MSDEPMIEVYDDVDGIKLEFHSGLGFSNSYYLDDETAENLILLIRNKLNERL